MLYSESTIKFFAEAVAARPSTKLRRFDQYFILTPQVDLLPFSCLALDIPSMRTLALALRGTISWTF